MKLINLVTKRASKKGQYKRASAIRIKKKLEGNSFICEFVRIPLTRPNRTSLTSIGGR